MDNEHDVMLTSHDKTHHNELDDPNWRDEKKKRLRPLLVAHASGAADLDSK